MDSKDVKKLEMASPIVQVATELGIRVRGSVGRCFRADEHPEDADELTLFFNAAKNSFTCRVCPDVGGSVVDLVCQYRMWDREEAVEWLSHRADFDQQTRELYYGKGTKK